MAVSLSPLVCQQCHLLQHIAFKQEAVKSMWRLTVRSESTSSHFTQIKRKVKPRMKAWQIFQYGGNEELTLSNTAKIPEIRNPNDILVDVHAASVNPIDVNMRDGYGRTIINQMRKWFGTNSGGSEFPLTLGRDFSGVVRQTGHGVSRFKPGDEVWGALAVERQGSHAQFCVAGEKEIYYKPKTLTHVEAASLPYVALTSWAALCFVGEMTEKNTPGKRVLIHGGAGGIGTFSIQLMKTWGAHVITTCSTDAVPLVKHLGVDDVIDYKMQDVADELLKLAKVFALLLMDDCIGGLLKCCEADFPQLINFHPWQPDRRLPVQIPSRLGFFEIFSVRSWRVDVVLDPLGGETPSFSMDVLKSWSGAKYVSLVMPVLPAMDQLGLVGGLAKSLADFNLNAVKSFTKGGINYRWAFFMPNVNALMKITRMIEAGQIQPVIDKVFKLEDLPEAFDKVGEKKGRGKTVIDIAGS